MTTDAQVNAYIETQSQAATDRAIILTKSREIVNFTTQEMADLLGWEYHHAQPRISQLVDKDLLKDTGLRREGRERTSAVWAYNPDPRPKQKRFKPMGDKKLFGEMMRTIYAFANKKVAHNEFAMDEALKIWGRSMAEMIRLQSKLDNSHKKDVKSEKSR